jgi:hypothetical protein
MVTVLRRVEVEIANGKTAPQACRECGITEQTPGVHRQEVAQMAGGAGNLAVVYRAGQPLREWIL